MIACVAVDLSFVLLNVLVGNDAVIRMLYQYNLLVLLDDIIQDVFGSCIAFNFARVFHGKLGLEVTHRYNQQWTHDREEYGHLPVDVERGKHGKDYVAN